MKRMISYFCCFAILVSAAVFAPSVFAEEENIEDHVIYSFTFEEEGATTILKKSGSTPGIIDTTFFAGDEETGASLALPIGSSSMTGKGGVLPYIWPTAISGVIAAQGELQPGEYYEFSVDLAWTGGVLTKKGTYVYPFMLINGNGEAYMQGTDHTLTLGKEFQRFVYRLGAEDFEALGLSAPQSGQDNGGIAFCCENTLLPVGTLYFDNVTLSKHGVWKPCDTSSIGYLEKAVAPTTYEPTDENGVTASGKQTTVLYENDFEGANPEHVFGYYNENIAQYFRTFWATDILDNKTQSDGYYIPLSSVPKGGLYSEGSYYPAIWFWNKTIASKIKEQKPLGKGDYYVVQFDMYCPSSGYAYAELFVGDKEYSPTYEWNSDNLSGNIDSLDAAYVTRYYVFQIDGLDLASASNCAFALLTDGYVHSYKPVYADNFKISVVRNPNLAGDVNNDKNVDMKDVLVLRKYLAGLTDTIHTDNADVNEDASINMKDVLVLRKNIASIGNTTSEANSDAVSEASA